MSELISIHVGQCGSQIGSRLWKVFGKEHGVNSDGYYQENNAPSGSENNTKLSSLYDESWREENKLKARCLFVDTDYYTVNQVEKDPSLSKLMTEENMIKGKEDSATYARGKITIGGATKGYIKERLRKMIEASDSPDGFLVTHSMEGGTGSGVTGFITEIMDSDYPKLTKSMFSVFPSQNFKLEVVEPYNTALALADLRRNSVTNVLHMENEALYNICKQYGVKSPSYTDVNDVITQTISTFTLPTRSNNSTCPILSPYNNMNLISSTFTKVDDVNAEMKITDLFAKDSKMSITDHFKSKSMLMDIAMRGNFSANQGLQFWTQTDNNLKVDSNHYEIFSKKTENIDNSSISFSNYIQVYNNSSAIVDSLVQLRERFLSLFHNRAFVFWYVGEGMEEGEFHEAIDELDHYIEDYSSFENSQPITYSKLRNTQ